MKAEVAASAYEIDVSISLILWIRKERFLDV